MKNYITYLIMIVLITSCGHKQRPGDRAADTTKHHGSATEILSVSYSDMNMTAGNSGWSISADFTGDATYQSKTMVYKKQHPKDEYELGTFIDTFYTGTITREAVNILAQTIYNARLPTTKNHTPGLNSQPGCSFLVVRFVNGDISQIAVTNNDNQPAIMRIVEQLSAIRNSTKWKYVSHEDGGIAPF